MMFDKRKILTKLDTQVNIPGCMLDGTVVVGVLVAPNYRQANISSLEILMGREGGGSLTNAT
jgi:hypothetical protein